MPRKPKDEIEIGGGSDPYAPPDEKHEPGVVLDEAGELDDEKWGTLTEMVAPEPEPAPEAKKSPITEFQWRGTTRYRCSVCQFDSADEAEVYKHYQTNHIAAPRKPETVDTGLVTASGDRIVRVQEVNDGTGTSDPS